MAIIFYTKKYSETLSEMLLRFNREFPDLSELKKTYAGRLDPLAEGVIPILTGEDVYRKDEYTSRDKKYRVRYLLGFSSDTLDALGLARAGGDVSLDLERLLQIHSSFLDLTLQEYPVFSSRPVQGRALYKWAREGKLDSIKIPKRPVKIYSSKFLHQTSLSKEEISSEIISAVSSVQGDFRQKEIIQNWKKLFDSDTATRYLVLESEFHVSSGTYVRSLVDKIGKSIDCGALSLKISRLNIDN